MLNLHPPFRLASPEDGSAISHLVSGVEPSVIGPNTIIAEDGDRVVAALSGHPEGDAWRIDLFAIAHDRRTELGSRLLAVADALAADEGLTSVVMTVVHDEAVLAFLDQVGFRASGLRDRLARDVIPQG